MKSIRLFFAASLLLAGSAYAEAQTFQDDSIGASSYQYHSADPLTPTYLDYAVGGLSGRTGSSPYKAVKRHSLENLSDAVTSSAGQSRC